MDASYGKDASFGTNWNSWMSPRRTWSGGFPQHRLGAHLRRLGLPANLGLQVVESIPKVERPLFFDLLLLGLLLLLLGLGVGVVIIVTVPPPGVLVVVPPPLVVAPGVVGQAVPVVVKPGVISSRACNPRDTSSTPSPPPPPPRA